MNKHNTLFNNRNMYYTMKSQMTNGEKAFRISIRGFSEPFVIKLWEFLKEFSPRVGFLTNL